MIASLTSAARKLSRNSKGASHKAVRRVVVVGGSAAGFYTSYLLARAGMDVRLLESSDELDPAPRTLIVTHRLPSLLGPVAEQSTINKIQKFELFTNGRAASIVLARPDLIIERATLIRSLAAQAREAGASIALGRRFSGLQASADELRVQAQQSSASVTEQFAADVVVGGDGVSSRVAQAAGWPPQQTVPLIQAIVPLPDDLPPDTVRVWFVPQETPYFYWLIPQSPSRAVAGLIGEAGPQTFRLLDTFLNKRKLAPLEFQGARVPIYTGWIPIERRLAGGRVFLVGDAAGQVKVTTVGGIVTGFRGALGVAESILGSGSSRELRALRRELNLHLLLRRLFHGFTQADYSRAVDLLNLSARRCLSVYSRDDVLAVLCRLCLSQPRLLLLGLRGLLLRGRAFAPAAPNRATSAS